MPKYNIKAGSSNQTRPLLNQLRLVLQAHAAAFQQERPFLRAQALVLGSLFAFGRRTMTQLLVSLGETEADWSAWYRLLSEPRWDYDELSRAMLQQTLPHVPMEAPYVIVNDGVQVPRSSQKMPGTAWLKNPRTPVFKPGIHRAQRFVHTAWLTPMEDGYSRAIPLRFWAAFTEKAVPSLEPARKEWQAGLLGIQWVREQLDAAGRQDQWLLALGDGSYDVKKIWPGLPERVTLMVRAAKNRALFQLPSPPSRKKGRRRKYGVRVRRPDAWLQEKDGWRVRWLQIRGRRIRLRYRVEGPLLVRGASEQPLFLIVVKGLRVQKSKPSKPYYKDPTFWLVSAVWRKGAWVLPYPAEQLLTWAWQRWEIEVSHREMKSGFGVGEMQCWSPESAILAVAWGAWMYAALVLAGYRAWGLVNGTVRPPGRWWPGSRRWSLGSLWRGYRQELWTLKEFRALCSGSEGNVWENRQWMAGLWNAINGSQRI